MLGQGAVLAGRYHLLEKIGEGGMGSVWLAHDDTPSPGAPSEVALKVLHKTLVGDPNAIARFRNEARAASGIEHANLCRVLDVGEADGSPFLVMERLHGENLADRLTREHSLPPVAAAEIMLEVLAGLAAAHSQNVLHRDLKPENVFLAREGERVVAKILDFGVSKFIGDDAERVKMTRTGALVGTPAYMSPEQALGLDGVDVRSDVWAAGVLLYEMLAGQLPYDAANYNAMLVKIATEAPRPLRSLIPAIDTALADVVEKALARQRDQRFGSARELSDALRAWIGGAPLRLSVPRVAMPTPLTTTTPMSWAEQASGETHVLTLSGNTQAPRRSWLLPTVLGVVLGIAGIAIAIGMRRTARATTPVPIARVATQPVAAPPSEHRLQVVGVPVGSRVRVNDADTVLPAVIHRGESAHIEIDAAGFEPWMQTVTPTGDVTLTFEGHRAVVVAVTDASASGDASANAPHVTGLARRNPRHGRQPLQGGVAPHPDF